jgi:hypothetical protein
VKGLCNQEVARLIAVGKSRQSERKTIENHNRFLLQNHRMHTNDADWLKRKKTI